MRLGWFGLWLWSGLLEIVKKPYGTHLTHTRPRATGVGAGGIPRGSPISPILFMIYNADLVDTLKLLGLDLALGFIDDVAYGVSGMTAELNAKALELVLKTSEEWRKKHGAKFDPGKYILIHFTRNYIQESPKRHQTLWVISISSYSTVRKAQLTRISKANIKGS